MTRIPAEDTYRLILASASPRRRDLLQRLGVRFRVVPSRINESVEDGESPEAHVSRLALEKAADVARKHPDSWVLGADTIVVIDEQILGKPKGRNEAIEMLSTLASRTHLVYTGYALTNVALVHRNRVRYVCSSVLIRAMTREEIEGYVDTGEPMDKAGSYAVQGIGSAIVASISGSYTNVVGLPLCEVSKDLKELGIFDFLGGNAKP